MEAKQVVGGDLQRNVYRNYTEFVTISKEVSNLDGDVFRLKGYINELKSIWEGFVEETNPSEDTKPTGKLVITPPPLIYANYFCFLTPLSLSPILESLGLNKAVLPQRKHTDIMNTDLQSIYRAQISALWDNVEGSQVNE